MTDVMHEYARALCRPAPWGPDCSHCGKTCERGRFYDGVHRYHDGSDAKTVYCSDECRVLASEKRRSEVFRVVHNPLRPETWPWGGIV